VSGTSSSYDDLYVSPHLDDVAFSCGGQIHGAAGRGRRILIVTLHTADPPGEGLSAFAEALHREWSLGPEAMAVRRQEDRKACAVLGAEPRHESELDAVYRRGGDGRSFYDTPEALRGRPVAADLEHLERLRRILAELPPAKRVYAPLAAGGHVDHRLTRRAAEAVFGRRLEYYEDYPYVRSRVVLVKALGFSLWRRRTVELETADLDAKVRAFGCFASQLSTAFADPEDMKRQVRVFFERRGRHKAGGERLWRRLL
jgi:LmbE family N-acetylglucosaminyl deacetylase